MATACIDITCPTGCSVELPEVEFDLCNPDVHYGQISDIFITNVGNPLVDETSPSEWAARLALPNSNPSKILDLFVIGSKPAAEGTDVEISKGRTVTGNKNHTVNFRIDEVSDKNYNMMRQFECGKTVLGWYKTYEGKLYGGNKGIVMSIKMNHAIPENASELETIEGTLTWKAKHHPCRTDYPLQGESDS
jgi:hypothetical protein